MVLRAARLDHDPDTMAKRQIDMGAGLHVLHDVVPHARDGRERVTEVLTLAAFAWGLLALHDITTRAGFACGFLAFACLMLAIVALPEAPYP